MTRIVPARFAHRGMTLIEVVLAMGLLAVLSSLLYWFYASSLATRHEGVLESQKLRLSRIVLERIVGEIRQAAMVPSEKGVAIRGDAEQIRLTTIRTPDRELYREHYLARTRDYESRRVEYDIVKVAYHIVRHPEIQDEDGYDLPIGLGRMEIRIPRPEQLVFGEAFDDHGRSNNRRSEDGNSDEDSEFGPENDSQAELDDEVLDAFDKALFGEDDESAGVGAADLINWEELYAPEIKYLRFCYFDGSTWWDSWNVEGENPLPQMVLVTIGFEGEPPFGEDFGRTENEEFCTCLNEDPVDCERLPLDRASRVVRLVQSDPLFRSRITREGQAFVEELMGETQ
ncbi:MAG: prepilin-type N-terminal cleavage/methylation domain-containing protein [Planctomycetes bacterium]|nr:prepilin-type N-terminal cleavage/methylation domain-containing protein [Planctomycetota bacterium]